MPSQPIAPPSPAEQSPTAKPRQAAVILMLALLAVAAYLPMRHNEFISFDDEVYITQNAHVREGLSPENVIWAFTDRDTMYWHPLTWLSLMLDQDMFGSSPTGSHFMSLAIHILNAALLFILLHQATGRFWAAALAAALFVLHPVNVDSVAWAAERKNVLSTLFLLLALLSYVEYVPRRSWARYAASLAFMLASLMAKPMAVVLPGLMLLMDWWPLNRFPSRAGHQGDGLPPHPEHPARLAAEKLPFIGLSMAFTLFTAASVDTFHKATESIPLGLRLSNAVVGYARYLGTFFVPLDLSILYPFPPSIPSWQVVGSALLIIALTALAVRLRHRAPFFGVGWLWFAGTLIPVSGILRIGLWPAMADRFAYVPFMGLYMALAWGAAALARQGPWRTLAPVASAAALAVLLGLTANQTRYWKDTLTLFQHALDTGNPSVTTYTNVGLAHYAGERYGQALNYFHKALAMRPDYAPLLNNIAVSLTEMDDAEGAEEYLNRAIEADPQYVASYSNLALMRLRQGHREEAMALLDKSLEIKPDYDIGLVNKAAEIGRLGRRDEAVALLLRAIESNPLSAQAHYNLGLELGQMGQREESLEHIKRALTLGAEQPALLLHIGHVLTTHGALDEAVILYRHILRQRPGSAMAHNSLGRAYSAQGRTEDAIGQYRQAIEIRPDYAPAYADLGKAYLDLNQPQPAIQALERALEIEPGLEQARTNLERARAALDPDAPPGQAPPDPS